MDIRYRYKSSEVVPIATMLNGGNGDNGNGKNGNGSSKNDIVQRIPEPTVNIITRPQRYNILDNANDIINDSKNILSDSALIIPRRDTLTSDQNTKQKNNLMTIGLLAVGAYLLFS